MLLKHKKTGDIYPYSEELFKSGKVTVYEPLICTLDDDDWTSTTDSVDYGALKSLPNDVIQDKDLMEQVIGRPLTTKEHKRIMETLHYGD